MEAVFELNYYLEGENEEREKRTEHYEGHYFLNSTAVQAYNDQNFIDVSKGEAEIIIPGLNFEYKPESIDLIVSFNNINYKILESTPTSGTGQSVTIFIGIKISGQSA
jgi:hypothetical protein